MHDRLLEEAREAGGVALALCGLTTNMGRASWQGNTVLDAGEAGLERASVVELSKLVCVGPEQLGEFVGVLGARRWAEVWGKLEWLLVGRARR